MSERTCTAHNAPQYEAETTERLGLTYVVLRCSECDRPAGQRLVRKAKASS